MAAIAATPIVMAFHVSIAAEYVCLIAPMFLAMYLRAFHPARQALPLITSLTAACMIAIAVAPARPVGVLTFLIITVALDIDGVKRLNDTYGHQAGDRHIIDYAHRWSEAAPRDAVLARLGGDEFAACIVGERSETVEAFLRSVQLDTPGASLGTATQPSLDANIADLHARADTALYLSRGRTLRDESGSTATDSH